LSNIEGKIKREECVDMDVESISPFSSRICRRCVRRRRKEGTISEEPVRLSIGDKLYRGINLTTAGWHIELPQEGNPEIP